MLYKEINCLLLKSQKDMLLLKLFTLSPISGDSDQKNQMHLLRSCPKTELNYLLEETFAVVEKMTPKTVRLLENSLRVDQAETCEDEEKLSRISHISKSSPRRLATAQKGFRTSKRRKSLGFSWISSRERKNI